MFNLRVCERVGDDKIQNLIEIRLGFFELILLYAAANEVILDAKAF